MDKGCQVTQTLSFDSILRAETTRQVQAMQGQVQGDRVRSKLSLVRNIQTGGEVGELVRYWAKSLDNEEDISTHDCDEDLSVENNEENCCEHNHCSTPTNPALTLVRGSSLSLVDIPTFLSPRVALGTVAAPPPLYDPRKILEDKLAEIRAKKCEPKMGKRSQWTVMCVALGFFSSCLVLVGGMLSITSDYQDRAINRMLNISYSHHTVRQST